MGDTVEELREKLVELGMTKDETLSLKGKSAVKDMIEKLEALKGANVDETVKETEEWKHTPPEPEVKLPPVPDYNSPEWEDYVLSLFTEKELAEGKYPKLNGLRRVAGLLLGEVIDSSPIDMISQQVLDHNGRAAVTYRLVFLWKLGLSPASETFLGEDLPQRVFTAIGGSHAGNTDDIVAKYPEAIAETRAEVRAYRKALRLSVVGADEITRNDMKRSSGFSHEKEIETVVGEGTKITPSQLTTITNMCKRLNIDLPLFINMGKEKYKEVSDVKYDTALLMIKQLSKYQSGGPESVAIPESILLKGN